jgi:hypothetical protein
MLDEGSKRSILTVCLAYTHDHYWPDSPVRTLAFLMTDITTNLFPCLGCQPYGNPQQSLRIDVFLSGLFPLADRSPFESVGNSLPALAWLSRKQVAKGQKRGYACIRLGRNTLFFLCSLNSHLSARCVPTGPHTTAVAPPCIYCLMKSPNKSNKWFQLISHNANIWQ